MNKKFLELSNVIEAVNSDNMSFVLKLNKQNLKTSKNVVKIPDIEEIFDKKIGKLFCVKYFVGSSQDKKMYRITSKNKNFSSLYTVDVTSKDLKPVLGIDVSKMNKSVFLNFFSDLVNNKKSNVVKENALEDFDMLPPQVKKILAYYFGFLGLILLIQLIYKYRYYITQLRNWISERYVSGPLEQQINAQLFSGQKEDEPAYLQYNKIISYIKLIANKKLNALIICGPPGMSKTYIVRRTLYFSDLKPKKDYNVEKGSTLSLKDVYSMLYYNRKKLLILDDFDTPLKNEECVNMLKSISDSYSKRILTMPREKIISQHAQDQSPTAPQKFEFSGQLIIITNLEKKDINSALLSRAPTIEVNFNTKEVINSLQLMLQYISPSIPLDQKTEVLNYVLSQIKKNPKIKMNFRTFQNCVDARVGSPEDWKDIVQLILKSQTK